MLFYLLSWLCRYLFVVRIALRIGTNQCNVRKKYFFMCCPGNVLSCEKRWEFLRAYIICQVMHVKLLCLIIDLVISVFVIRDSLWFRTSQWIISVNVCKIYYVICCLGNVSMGLMCEKHWEMLVAYFVLSGNVRIRYSELLFSW